MGLYEKALEIMKERDESHFTKKAAIKILSEFPDAPEYVLEAGFTPSGKVHLGNFGDILITESVRKVLELWGYKAHSILVIDSRDPFRKPPVFLPEEFKKKAEEYLGKPLEMLPDPWGCHKNFVEHFVEPVISSLDEYGLYPKIVYASEIHTNPKYIELLRGIIINRGKVRTIFNRVHERAGHSKRYPEDWIPYRPLCKGCGRIDEHVKALNVSKDGYKIEYRCDICGYEGIADVRRAEGKPPWRIDWPLRWALFSVHFEPMGKDLMAAGSSYDTGRELMIHYFGRKPPVAIFYDFIYWVEPGKQPVKFSKRAGIGLGAHEWLKYAPPEVLNYMLLKRHVGDIEKDSLRHVDFNIYEIPKYVNRFDADEETVFQALQKEVMGSDEKKAFVAYFLSIDNPEKLFRRKPRRIPYNVAMRVALWMSNIDEGLKMLRRIGVLPKGATKEEVEDAAKRLECALNFIREYWKPPSIDIRSIIQRFNDVEKKALYEILREALRYGEDTINQEILRSIIRKVSESYGLKPKGIYRMLYLVAIGEETGPQAYRLFQKKFSRDNLSKALEILGEFM